jgi:GT2 family glycosyltransferase
MPGASRAFAQQAGFATGADVVLLIGAPGLLHPQSCAAVMRMSEAQEGRALLEVVCVPNRESRPVNSQDFSLPWVGGPAIAIHRSLHDAVGGPDELLESKEADQDYSQRARAHGFDLLLCPRALFYTDQAPVPAAPGDRRVA